ncbi:MAG: 50S ribosomal protein L3 [Syntrophobacterales bacterium]|nr:MAG: 50S ribosomal protein L3 [Syntrophobacterales bacterium]
MIREIIGKKLGMTRLFSQGGDIVPVTVIEAGPCPIIQKKTKQRDGYDALQVGFLPKKPTRVNRPLMGHLKKSGRGAFYILKEVRVDEIDTYELGQEIAVDIFQPGDLVDVTGTSKGRGFSGVMKRHGFRGAPASHGTHEYFRHGGSIGAAADPSRTFKGKKMPGHYGNRRVTIQNIEVVEVRPQQNLIFLKGVVPGWRNGIVTIRQAKKGVIPPRPDSREEKREEVIKEKTKAEVEAEQREETKAEVEAKAKVEAGELVEGEAKEEEVKVKAEVEEEVKDEVKAEVEADKEKAKEEVEAEKKEEIKAEVKEESEKEDKAKAEVKEKAKRKAEKEEP